MSIVLVDGHERMRDDYKAIGDKHGHKIKVFTQMPTRFNKSIGQSDAIGLFFWGFLGTVLFSVFGEVTSRKLPLLFMLRML
ncbi:DUF2325 domain-containing protein [Sedimentibacter sp. MB31-C6]|uniref:DUF2325 domain-containing protein n=1 Tax=Sedimentibacter sp. MB31-C6 TaxID=3109366 RepID=UPI002DDD920A|nr:DUF2325 domain-containing protein [Sedimentibacter sp. MB36-C1]WSI03467.1 DUF2325 domain-containing protein [Sedimentibacter sp. MB36-C1]